ncbi:MAG: ABC transporter permease [Clostridioides difficile]|nr:ABC transporter permease [Clostridioides difficile]
MVLPVTLNTPEYLLPSLGKVFQSFLDFITGYKELNTYSGMFFKHSTASLYRVIIGFIIASISGMVFGVLSGYFLIVKRLFDPFIHIIRMIPGIGWFPIAMVWFGVGNKTTIFLIALAAFFPVYVNTIRAVSDVDKTLIDASRVLGANSKDVLKTVIIPSSLPGIFSGLRLSMGVCWSYLVLGELTGVNEGLGAVMMDSRMLGNVDMIIVCMISISIWGRICDLILQGVFKFLTPSIK